MVPFFIFKSTFAMDHHTFLRSWGQIFLLAMPGLVISGCVTGLTMMLLLMREKLHVTTSISLGVLISTIYPVEVIHALKEHGQAKQLSTLLEGEAIIGAGTVLILYNLLVKLMNYDFANIYEMPLSILWHVLSGLLIGFVTAQVLVFVMHAIYSNTTSMLTLTFAAACLVYHTANKFVNASGVIALFVLGFITGGERQSLSTEMENFLLTFWSFVGYLVNCTVCVLAGFFTVYLIKAETAMYDCSIIVVTYIVALCGRVFTYSLLTPIVSRIGYGLTFKGMIIAIWSLMKGPIPFILALEFYINEIVEYQLRKKILLLISALQVLTVLINGLSAGFLLNVLGISQVSELRKVNMNSCMRHVQTRRFRTIAVMKMNRFLSDANWRVVIEVTQITHPYKPQLQSDQRTSKDDEDTYSSTRLVYCPDCKRELPYEPSRRDWREILREARIRILRSKKMSYIRQYQTGMLCKDSVKILCQAVEVAIDTPDAVIDLAGLYKYFKRQSFFNYICNKLVVPCLQETELKTRPPRRRWRRVCYYLISNSKFDWMIYIFILCDSAAVLVEWLCAPTWGSNLQYILIVVNTVLFLIFFVEFILNIYAFSFIYVCANGFRTYFSIRGKIFDFVLLCTEFLHVIVEYVFLLPVDTESFLWQFTIVLEAARLLRMLSLLKLCKVWYPNMIQYFNSKVDAQLAFAYDIGKGYVTAEEEVAAMLSQIIDHKGIREKCQDQIDGDRLSVTKELGIIQKDRPWIAVTVKTKQAVRSTLNSMKAAVDDLKALGWLDEYEYFKLNKALEERHKYVDTKMTSVEPLSPKELLKEVSWMSDQSTYHYLYNNVVTKLFDPGDIICADGDLMDGIYIIVTGLLKMTYAPKMHTLERLQSFGILPIMDYISSAKFDQRVEEYLVTGNSIGELCMLTGRAYDCTIKAETASQVYHIRKDVLTKAFTMNNDPINGLEAKMWKFATVRLCASILMDTPAYQSITFEQIQVQLQRGFIPNLSKYSHLNINDTMEDLILIEGVVYYPNSEAYATAPCYVPRTEQKIYFPRGEFNDTVTDPKLMIIPANDLDQVTFQENEDEMAEISSNISVRCLRHYVLDKKLSGIKQKRRNQSFALTKRVNPRGTSIQSFVSMKNDSASRSSECMIRNLKMPSDFSLNNSGSVQNVNIFDEFSKTEEGSKPPFGFK
ncbi:hypothetical protein PPYR_06960 [Photinus pyralis]|uniref:Cyclic nucleotide-binding domain-containing protein n=4 Tax=Photinus pyralis TaxID=7054 RepID=A0A5N4AP28_PHOPY|nr:hypothetical protein PPYR_06960 [Photinus pyralis]